VAQIEKARSLAKWTWLLVVLVALYSGYVLFSRRQENRRLEKAAQKKEAEADRRIVEQYGSGELKILMFYGNPPTLSAGSKGLLCYGVSNAKSARIEPLIAEVTPSLSRCVDVTPSVSTTYTFIATDANGKTQSASAKIDVR
jgi:hypothetical protein